jgi:hypothetical protein
LSLGFTYDPVGDRWDRVPVIDRAVEPFQSMCATGSTLYVWGGAPVPNPERRGRDLVGGGYAYDPTRARWEQLPTAGQPSPRAGPLVSCSERELVVWGGFAHQGLSGGTDRPLDDGGVYSVATRSWRRIRAPARAPDTYPITTVFQNRVISIGGANGSDVLDLAADHWRPMAPELTPTYVERCVGCALSRGPRGLRLFPVAGTLFALGSKSAGAYDPVGDAWTRIEFPWETVRVAVTLGDRLVVWGAKRPADTAGCYDNNPGRCDDGTHAEAAELAAPR